MEEMSVYLRQQIALGRKRDFSGIAQPKITIPDYVQYALIPARSFDRRYPSNVVALARLVNNTVTSKIDVIVYAEDNNIDLGWQGKVLLSIDYDTAVLMFVEFEFLFQKLVENSEISVNNNAYHEETIRELYRFKEGEIVPVYQMSELTKKPFYVDNTPEALNLIKRVIKTDTDIRAEDRFLEFDPETLTLTSVHNPRDESTWLSHIYLNSVVDRMVVPNPRITIIYTIDGIDFY